MSRRHRSYTTGGIYHIIQRGHNRAYIFKEHSDKAVFLKIVRAEASKQSCYLLYYVLMENHYHMVVEMRAKPIDAILQHINYAYSKYYNQKYKRSGTIYGERCKAIPITSHAYFRQLIFYIANNPVKARITGHPDNYQWSTHHEIITKRRGITSRQRLFEILSGSTGLGNEDYQAMMACRFDPAIKPFTQNEFQRLQRIATLRKSIDSLPEHNEPDNSAVIAGPPESDAIANNKSRDLSKVLMYRDFIREVLTKGYLVSEISTALQIPKSYIYKLKGATPQSSRNSANR